MINSNKRIFSLKYKISLQIFFSCFIVLMLVKFLTPYLLNRDFIEKAKDEHYKRFSMDIQNYIEKNGEWGTDKSVLEFIDSVQPINRPPDPFTNHSSNDTPPLNKPPMNNPQQLKFGLTDQNGMALMPFFRYQPGDKVRESDIKKGTPILYKNEIVAYAIADGVAIISENNKEIVRVINQIINYNIILALFLAVIVGLTSGRQLTRSIRTLTSAAESLGRELNGQQVTNIKSNDEIGILTNVLNTMSLELEKSHSKIKDLSITDELTGLFNRRFFNEQVKILLPNSFRDKQPISLVLGDIDFFKQVNDNYSHVIGDEVLREVANIIRSSLREGDILARFGGEEMIMALHNADNNKAFSIIERMREKIQSFNWDSIAPGLKISMSFGICCKKLPTNYKEMLCIADKRLYKAKTSGRNRTIIE